MQELMKSFNFGQKEVRTIVRKDVWFVAKDVCEILGIKNTTQAVGKLDEDERAMLNIGRQGVTNIINESGLYSLILTSRKDEAKRFKRWITHEVLPSIRKTGSYSLNVPKTFSEALRLAADLQEKIERDQPKVEAHDRFISGTNYQKVGQVAKALGYGRNNLFKILREMKILMNDNTPYQQYIDRGYFVVKERPITMGDETINKPQTYVTAKGVDYLDNKLNKQKGA